MRALKHDERALWREAMRGVKPLRPLAAEEEAGEAAPTRETKGRRVHGQAVNPVARQAGGKSLGALDRRTAARLKRGTLAIEARLDLHGMTQSEAHAALARFLARAQKHGTRAVLVITGKSGVLHGAVPRWLDEGENHARILAYSRAHAQHGGQGALYIMLRRQR